MAKRRTSKAKSAEKGAVTFTARRAALLFACLTAIAAFALFMTSQTATRPQTVRRPVQKNVTLRFNWIDQPLFVGYYIAKDDGLYAAEGLNVTFKPYKDGLDQTAEVAEGASDFTLSSSFEILAAVSAGKDVKAVASVLQQLPEAYASLKSSHITSPADFKGKVLGIKEGNASTGIVYKSLMSRFGLKPSDATFKTLDYSMDVAGDLVNHRADVIHFYRNDEGYTLAKKGVAYDLILPEQYGGASYGDVLTTSGGLIRQDPDLVRRFVAASVRGWEIAVSDPDKAYKVMRAHEDAQYKDEAYEKYIYSHSLPLIIPTGGERIGYMGFSVWKDVANMMIQSGALPKDFPVTDAYTTKFLVR
ncbi:MAG: hypothetical protein RLZZ324_301 [Candidatus Parcubacteria bacterium]|jgi:ABC-type nitrate/sulfonate/bicarbonate transport system substrate-binding protein